ncbi:pyridoxamine 5'-phosphate oxidase family protein [Actinomarinicola tropica]|uniref:Pyridoxamine 5'-phosphate oxidase family protein n=1 Tax=Actinomarinicola tropica TaxID=2789776 RepID=A0A5Q2RDC8_9ACTN|nr:pyridoxamine 5'-phosphate oxidase family protein [Actinomarinicola tropica]QGG93663.1 pyridoxamine 5'-phosphate oxidase family protein [Actinomarinicola tropica]
MSVPVPLDALAAAVDRYGEVALVVTVGDDGRPHTVSAPVRVGSSELEIEVGRTSARNAIAHPAVAVVWPPVATDPDHLLIVDGDAVVTAGGGQEQGGTLRVHPTRAVQHRRADADPSLPSCIPIEE